MYFADFKKSCGCLPCVGGLWAGGCGQGQIDGSWGSSPELSHNVIRVLGTGIWSLAGWWSGGQGSKVRGGQGSGGQGSGGQCSGGQGSGGQCSGG